MRTIAAPDFATLREALAQEFHRLREAGAWSDVTIVTRGDLDREMTRRDLAVRLGGTLGVRVVSLAGWARQVAGPAMARAGGRRISAAALERIVSRACPDDIPGVSRLFAAAIQDLRQARIEPAHLAPQRGEPATPWRGELARVFAQVSGALGDKRRFDAIREEELAAEVLAAGEPRAGSPLFMFGFHDLTARQRALMQTAARIHEVTFFIPGPGGAGEEAAASLLEWARERGPFEVREREGVPLLSLEESMFSSPRVAAPDQARVELLTCEDDSAQIRAIARRIRDEVTIHGRTFDEFMIVVPPTGPGPRLIRRIFARAGVPLEDRAGISASRTFAGRRALALARGLVARDDRAAVRALEFLTVVPEEPVSSIEEDVRTQFLRARDALEIVAAFRKAHRDRFGEETPPRVDEALEAIAEAHGELPLRPREFPRELAAALSGIRDRDREERGGARVRLVLIDQARGLERAVVFFPGLVAGALATLPSEDPLLSDAERESLNERFAREGRALPLKRMGPHDEALLLRFALESATECAILSWSPRARTGGSPRLPAGLLVELASERTGALSTIPLEPASDAISRPVDLIDLEHALLRAAFPLDEPSLSRVFAEGGARFLERAVDAARARWTRHRLTAHDGVLASSEARAAVRDALGGASRAWSTSNFEKVLACPFSFLATRVLGLEPPRETLDDLDARDRGTIVHEILARAFGTLAAEHRLPLDSKSLPRALECVDHEIDEIQSSLAAAPPVHRITVRSAIDEIRRDLGILLAREAHSTSDISAVPLHFELQFPAHDSSSPPVSLTLPSGRSIPLSGKIDRIDARRDGSLEIVDYKSGQLAKPGALVEAKDTHRAVHLQLPVYAHAAGMLLDRPVSRARYVATSSKGGFRNVSWSAEEIHAALPRVASLVERALGCVEGGWFPSLPRERCCTPALACLCGASAAARHHAKRGDAQLERHLQALGTSEPPEDGDDE